MKCVTCGSYFRQHSFNRTLECDDCVSVVYEDDLDSEMQVEMSILTNPSGKVQPMIYEDRDTDSL